MGIKKALYRDTHRAVFASRLVEIIEHFRGVSFFFLSARLPTKAAVCVLEMHAGELGDAGFPPLLCRPLNADSALPLRYCTHTSYLTHHSSCQRFASLSVYTHYDFGSQMKYRLIS